MINFIGLKTFVLREINRFMRVAIQTLVTPWISAVLFIFIFGYVVGQKIELVDGVRYIDFIIPGILMMNVISSAFSQVSSSLYFQRFMRSIEEILVAPLSYFEMIAGYVIGGVVRGVIVGLGVLAIGFLFGAANIEHFWLFLFYVVSISIIFSLIGILVGLWSNGFEQLAVLNTFVIMPLSFLGGVFNSVSMLPEKVQSFVILNPFFYFIDGIRYSMIGVKEANTTAGLFIIFFLIIFLSLWVGYLFKKGWKLRV
jgi:ABC-2 type transport system permease protein